MPKIPMIEGAGGKVSADLDAAIFWAPAISPNVIDDNLTAPPSSPATGAAYIPKATASGDWAGKEGHIMEWSGTAWVDLKTLAVNDHFLVSDSPGGGGSFNGQAKTLARVTAIGTLTYSFDAPETDALLMITRGVYIGQQRYYNGSAWTQAGTAGPTGPTGPAGNSSGLQLWFNNAGSDITGPSITASTHIAFVNSNPDTITSTTHDFVALGFKKWQKIAVTGAAQPGNNGTFTINSVATNTLTLIVANALTAEAEGATVTITADKEDLTKIPASGVEQDESVTVSSTDTNGATVDSYATASGVPGQAVIPAGSWQFHFWTWINNSGGTNTWKFQVSKVTGAGVETELFVTTTSSSITATTLATAQELTVDYTQVADISLLLTDRIMIRPVATTTGTNKVFHWVYQGTSRASHIDTPLAVVTAQAAGLLSATTVVSVSGATAPVLGQVLTATSSTAATWQTPSTGGGGNSLIRVVAGSYQVLGTEGTRAIGQFYFNPSWITAGKSTRICYVGAVSDAANTGTIKLYNLTDAEFVTGTTLTITGSTAYSYQASGALTVGAAAGNLKNTAKLYEVQFSTDGGTELDILMLSTVYLEFY